MRVRRRGRTALIVVGVCVVAVGALAALGLFLAPRVLPNLFTSTAEADTPQTLSADGATAAVTVPAGWRYGRAWGDDAEMVVHTPDGRLSITLTLRGTAESETFATAVTDAAPDVALGATATERLASGLEILHAASASDAEDAPGVFIAAVGGGAAPSVQIVARSADGRLAEYRAVLATLVESVRVPA